MMPGERGREIPDERIAPSGSPAFTLHSSIVAFVYSKPTDPGPP